MIATVELLGPLQDQLRAEALHAFPRECCGLVEGVVEGSLARLVVLHSVRNIANEPDRFGIDPAQQIALLRKLRVTGRAIIGCYHSHPNGRAEPSSRDRESAVEDGFLWLIAAATPNAAEQNNLAAFVSTGQAFSAVEIVNAPGTAGLRPAAGGTPAIPGVDRSAAPLL